MVTAKGSNLIGDADYEKRATMFGRELHRDNRTDRELLDEALKVAAGADVIVAALGESSEMSGESSSRTNLEMPDVQRALLQELLKTGKPVVLVLLPVARWCSPGKKNTCLPSSTYGSEE